MQIEDVWRQRECIKFGDVSQAVVKMHKLLGCIRDVSQAQKEIEEHLVVVAEGRLAQLNAVKRTSWDVGFFRHVAGVADQLFYQFLSVAWKL